MDLLLILTYVGICVAVFKIFKIPLNKWTVPTAVLGGVVLIGTLVFVMNYNHPYAKYAKEVFVTVPIVPQVRGQVVSVEVTPNQPVQQGDVLFRIDPVPFELAVIRKRAQLADISQTLLEEEEVWKTARAQVNQARAERDRVRQEFERYAAAPQAFSQQQIDNRRQRLEGAEAALEAAIAQENRARLQTDASFEGEDARVAQLRAELRQAEYDLENTVVRAPSDGLVTQLALRPGAMAVPMPLRPALVFIPQQERLFVASFWQNSMRLIEPGMEVELTLDAVPGHVFKGKVRELLPAMAEGEYQFGGSLISASAVSKPGRALASIELEDDLTPYNLPRGVQGKAVVYTDRFTHVAVMRRVLLRMVGWLNFLYPVK